MRELYVWYRVAPAAQRSARGAALAMQATLREAAPGLVARLLVRAEPEVPVQTWMESYALPGSEHGIDIALEAAIESHAAALRPFIDGDRHAEAFRVDPG